MIPDDGASPGPLLVLGGTAEARAVAAELGRAGARVISSLAGRVRAPRLPVGEVRIGGFGGPAGLADWLRRERAVGVLDATHPFAERISASAVTAARMTGLPLLRLERPGWQPGEGDDWRWVDTLDEAAAAASTIGDRIFLTSGRQGMAAFADLIEPWFLIRCVDLPDSPLPPRSEILLGRGPYTEAGEYELMHRHRIDVLVTKDSGGRMTAAKLTAARRLGVPVVMVRRPSRPDTETVRVVDDAVTWATSLLGTEPLEEQHRNEETTPPHGP